MGGIKIVNISELRHHLVPSYYLDHSVQQCWKFPQVRQSEADNFGGGLGTFCWFSFNLMFMIWDSSHEDLQLFDWVSNAGVQARNGGFRISQAPLFRKGGPLLTNWGRDKMDAISLTFSSAFFLSENVCIPIIISLKFVPEGPINNIPALVEIMAWRRPGDKPLSQPMVVSLPMNICVTLPQWVQK